MAEDTLELISPAPHHQLGSFIALSAPVPRPPSDGSESGMRVEFGFTPEWYHHHDGIDTHSKLYG